ncbi:MAG: hypothetical protein EOP33_01020 [Rickettsiaceae bacterium]|nr:MAG: hypothetical protein EOP33_01020 [Rickettsiaceae bacterium]
MAETDHNLITATPANSPVLAKERDNSSILVQYQQSTIYNIYNISIELLALSASIVTDTIVTLNAQPILTSDDTFNNLGINEVTLVGHTD